MRRSGGRRGGLKRTGRTGADEANEAEGGILDQAWRGVRGGLGSLGQACQRTRRTDWDAHVQVDWPLRILGPRGFQEYQVRMRTMGSFGSIHRGSTSDSSVLILSSSSWGLTLQRRKEPLPVTSFLVRWELSTSRIPCSSKWGMPSATS